MKGLEMVKCESLRINMFRITHTGKSVNFPVTADCIVANKVISWLRFIQRRPYILIKEIDKMLGNI